MYAHMHKAIVRLILVPECRRYKLLWHDILKRLYEPYNAL